MKEPRIRRGRKKERKKEGAREKKMQTQDMETVVNKTSRLPHPQKSPWLIYFSHGKRGKSHTFYSLSQGRSYVRNIPELRRKNCMASSYGWLFMEDMETMDCLLLNPVSLETVRVPQLPTSSEYSYNRSRCILSAPPTDPNCVILFTDWYLPVIMYWHRLHHKWHTMRYKISEEGGIVNLVACNGKAYGITADNEKLVVIEFNPNPKVTLIEAVVPPNVLFRRSKSCIAMVESCEEIFIVYKILRVPGVVHTIDVFKMDFSKMMWVRVESIGDRAFFLRADGCPVSYSSGESGIKGDCIYYLHHEDPTLYRFDMTDKSITMDLPCPNLSTPWSQAHWLFPSSI